VAFVLIVELQRLALAAGWRDEEEEALARHGRLLEELALDLRVEEPDAAAAHRVETLDFGRVVGGFFDLDLPLEEDCVEERERGAVRLGQRRLPWGWS